MASRSIMRSVKEATKEQAALQDDVDDVDNNEFESIDKLQELGGINASDIKRLKAAGVATVGMVTKKARRELMKIKGFSEAKTDKIIAAAVKLDATGSTMFMTGAEAMRMRDSVVHVTTGCKALDELIGGGLETRSLTEVAGEYRTGKTQLCHTLCVTSQLPMENGGGEGKVIYVDTEGTFRPERVKAIAARWNLDADAVLENISYVRVFTTEQQLVLMDRVAERLVEDEDRYRLMIVDSLTSLFRLEFQGRGELADRQQRLGKYLAKLNTLAAEFNLAIFVVNQVMSDPGAGMTYVNDPKKAIGGHVVAHACATRLMLRKGAGDTRICKVYDSPCMPEADATFAITALGIQDVDD